MDRPRKRVGKRFWKAYTALYGEANPDAAVAVPKRRSGARIRSATPKCPTEFAEQCALVAWARAKRLPLVAIPNAARRSPQEGARQKAAGLSPGFPDLMLLVRRLSFGGAFIELKRLRGGTVAEEQAKWHDWLNQNGYYTVVARGAEDAIRQVQIYLSLPIA